MEPEIDHLLDWDEFLALPHETRNTSLIDGEVVVNPPNVRHELVVQNLMLQFSDWRRSGDERGECSTQQPVKITDQRGYQPDFAWYPQELCAPPDEPPSFSGDPHLIVEVLSPTTRRFDLLRKRQDYDMIGIRELWFVDCDEHVVMTYQRPTPEEPFLSKELHKDDVITSPMLDGLEIDVESLFQR